MTATVAVEFMRAVKLLADLSEKIKRPPITMMNQIGEYAKTAIKQRTARGKDVEGSPFKGYSSTMLEKFTIIVEQGEDGYLISEVVGLPGCHTQAKTQEELIERTKEAIQLYLEAEGKPENRPKFIGIQQVEIEV